MCPSGDLLGYYGGSGTPEQNGFAGLRASLPVTYARFFIPYDAVYTYYNGGCTLSPGLFSVGGTDFDGLVYDIQAAEADGLTPVIAFESGTGVPGVGGEPADPIFPDPTYGSNSSSPVAYFTTAGFDYLCGVDGVMYALGQDQAAGYFPTPVTRFEAFNEPNGVKQTSNNSYGGGYNGALGPTSTYPNGPCGQAYYGSAINDCGGDVNPGGSSYLCDQPGLTLCGPIEASELWILAQDDYQTNFASSGFQIAAATISDAQNTAYESSYIEVMDASLTCFPGYICNHALTYPSVWSVHDYDDPSSAQPNASADISAFTSELNSAWGSGQQVWITESALDLNDAANKDANGSSACGSGDTFGDCIDGNPSVQVTGAQSFLGLHNASNNESITQTDYYELQADNPAGPPGTVGFDSGLESPPNNPGAPLAVPSPDGGYSIPRYSLCVLDHISTTLCSQLSPNASVDASDWSDLVG